MGQTNSISSLRGIHHTPTRPASLSSTPAEHVPATEGQSPNPSTPSLQMDTSPPEPPMKRSQRPSVHQTILGLVKRLIIPTDMVIALSTPHGTHSPISAPSSRKFRRSSKRWSKRPISTQSWIDDNFPPIEMIDPSSLSDQFKDNDKIEPDGVSDTGSPVLSSNTTVSPPPSTPPVSSPLSSFSPQLDSALQGTSFDSIHLDAATVSGDELQTTTSNRPQPSVLHPITSRPQSVDGNIPAMYSTPPSPTFDSSHIPTSSPTTDDDINASPSPLTSQATQRRKRGQQVRFANTATLSVYLPESSIHAPSSPTFSVRSLSSIPESALSPLLIPLPSHTFLSPLPPQIHRILRSHHDIRYDLTRPPSTAVMHNRRPLPRRVLSEPASYPGITYLEIACQYLPRRIPVRAPSSSVSVSVSDVLTTLYVTLRRNASERSYRSLMPDIQREVRHAYRRRYSNMPHPQAREEEKQGGLKKVDWLMEQKWFAGLRTTDAPSVWMLEVT